MFTLARLQLAKRQHTSQTTAICASGTSPHRLVTLTQADPCPSLYLPLVVAQIGSDGGVHWLRIGVLLSQKPITIIHEPLYTRTLLLRGFNLHQLVFCHRINDCQCFRP